ncbi:MAG TPA: SPFH domain-containing protein [Stellaceae bacterium]|jgi:flotillin|nr:SPFH domain-containing protein [Stellaceae bacterium]
MTGFLISVAVIVVLALVFVKFVFLPMLFRIVVGTAEIHVVQGVKNTTGYGKDQPAGNVYYRWPAWVPMIGVRVSKLPVSVFQLNLDKYPAYDKGRVPFNVDIIAFFRVTDPIVASQRITTMDDLQPQLEGILKGALRAILASSEIEEILEARSKFGSMFTQEVDTQLKEWGIQSVKSIELMDIRDADDSKAIQNIMAKKKSLIERESRIAVAENRRAAEVAEVEAEQAIEIRKRESEQAVGLRAAERDQAIGIRNQQSQQAVKEEEARTAEKTMAVNLVNTVRQAEITRQAEVVAADQAKQVAIIAAEAAKQRATIDAEAQKSVAITTAEGRKQQAVLEADGSLEAARRSAEGKLAIGQAEGSAEQARLMAPVNSQIALAKEIGGNDGYQRYLLTIEQIKAGQAVGIEAAKALQAAGVKIVATTGSGPVSGVRSVMDMFTPAGAMNLGAALDAFKDTDAGADILSRVTGATASPGNGAAKDNTRP